MAGRAQGSWAGIAMLVMLAWLVGRCSSMSNEPRIQASGYADPLPTPLAEVAPQPAAVTDVRYVAISSLNMRAEPNGAVVGRVTRGNRVAVSESRNGWLAVTSDTQAGWIAERFTCRTEGCWKPVAAPSRPPPPRQRLQQTYGSECPCSGSANCFGPRGGRYCITSGGNKRYR